MIWAVVALNVIVLIGPPLFSTDVFSYQAYARMFAIYHTNPYLHGPSVIQLDPVYNYIGAKWIDTPSVYGPLFTFISGAFASFSISASEFAFKLIASLASGGTLYLLWVSAKVRGLNPVRSVALFGLNPLVTLYGVGGGHNDLLMLLFTTWGVYAVLTHRERAGGALITASAAIKLTGGVVLPFALLSGVKLDAPRRRRAIPDRRRGRRRRDRGRQLCRLRHRHPAHVQHAAERPGQGRMAEHPRLPVRPRRS